MVYQWKTPGFYKVTAQDAGEELDRISTKCELTPAVIVDESRDDKAVLHNCFDWNDATAAESYRCVQASQMLRNIVTVRINDEEVSTPTRAFVSIQNTYKPIDVVIKTADYQQELLNKAYREMESFRIKYANLNQLACVIDSIDMALKEAAQRHISKGIPKNEKLADVLDVHYQQQTKNNTDIMPDKQA